MLTRREFVIAAAGGAVVASAHGAELKLPAQPALKSMTSHLEPIGASEMRDRIVKAQQFMAQRHIGALLIEPGTSLEYFTGVDWRRSERITLAVIPVEGEPIIVTPAFEEPSVRESFRVSGDVRVWNEHESPYQVIVQALRDRAVPKGPIAVESTLRFFIVAGLREIAPEYEIVTADALVRTCRLIKSPAELALMQAANDVTIAALQYAHSNVQLGMTATDVLALMIGATRALGGTTEFSLVLLNDASAYPHGSIKPQSVRRGSTILIDSGCTVHGYQSDISRTWFFGEPSAKQRKVWNTVKRGQEIALENAKVGVLVGTLDDAVRQYYESQGWGPGYKLPGLPHRTGHGIGLDGHEPAYLVHGDPTPLAAGMCFSDEPGLYIPGEFGVRLEDCWYMTDSGPKTFTRLARSVDQPI